MIFMSLIKACVFDAYGTLFSLDFPIEELDKMTNGKGEALMNIWRQKQIEYTWLRSLMQSYTNFENVTKDALNYTLKRLDIDNGNIAPTLLPVYLKANAFSEVPLMLQTLKIENITTAILSNGTKKMLIAGTENAGITQYIDQILTVDDIGVFKPDPKVYQMAAAKLGIDESAILFISSNPWDVAGASAYGLKTVWVKKNNQEEEVSHKAKYIVDNISELPQLLKTIGHES